MEVRFFTETYNSEYGSVFEKGNHTVLNGTSSMEHCEIMDAEQIFDSMTDFMDDRNYKYFVDSITQASKIIVFMKDVMYPDDVTNIYEIVIE